MSVIEFNWLDWHWSTIDMHRSRVSMRGQSMAGFSRRGPTYTKDLTISIPLLNVHNWYIFALISACSDSMPQPVDLTLKAFAVFIVNSQKRKIAMTVLWGTFKFYINLNFRWIKSLTDHFPRTENWLGCMLCKQQTFSSDCFFSKQHNIRSESRGSLRSCNLKSGGPVVR